MVTTNDTHKVFVDAVEPKPYRRDCAKFFNGSLGTVLRIGHYDDAPEKDYVAVHLDSGLDLLFYRQTYSVYQYEVDDEGHITRTVIGTYQQFPLRPAYAVTIHKSQGQTYECANIDPACRSSGQLYVALSRVKSIQGMHLDHKIQPWNLFLDSVVKEFYDNLGKPRTTPQKPQEETVAASDNKQTSDDVKPEATVVPEPVETIRVKAKPKSTGKQKEKKKGQAPTPKGGRPTRFLSGSVPLRVPRELEQPFNAVLSALYPEPSKGTPDKEKIQRLINVLQEISAE